MENGPRKSGVFQPPPQIFSILTFCNNKFPPVKRHIPNIITSLNLVSGCIASYFAANANLDFALYFMLLGLLFDFFDGFTARLLGVSSPIGKELDSLADVVTFGVTPSLMLFHVLQLLLPCTGAPAFCPARFVPYLSFAIAAYSATRLAKFNLDTRQSHSFIGLPTPANALFWAGITTYLNHNSSISISASILGATMVLLIGFSCWIMISEVPMFALKFQNFTWKDNKVRYGFLTLVVAIVIAGIALEVYALALSLLIVLYALISLCVRPKQ